MPKSVEAWGLMTPDGELLTFSAYEPDAFPKVLEAMLELTPGTVGELMKDYTPIRVVITVKEVQEMTDKREWMLQAALVSRVGKTCRTVADIGAVYDAICAATAPETDWVEHDGDVSKAPPPGAQVEVRYRGPELNLAAIGEVGRADELAWDWCDSPTDVVVWRYA